MTSGINLLLVYFSNVFCSLVKWYSEKNVSLYMYMLDEWYVILIKCRQTNWNFVEWLENIIMDFYHVVLYFYHYSANGAKLNFVFVFWSCYTYCGSFTCSCGKQQNQILAFQGSGCYAKLQFTCTNFNIVLCCSRLSRRN